MPVLIPIVAAIAGAAAGYAAVAAAGVVASSILGGLILAAVGGIVSVAVTYGLNAVFGLNVKAKGPTAAAADDRKVMTRLSIAPRVVVYGSARVSGNLVYAGSSGSTKEFLHLVVALAGHQIQSIGTVFLNDQPITADQIDGAGAVTGGTFAGKVRIKKYLGNQTTADADLVAESLDGWSADHKLQGIAYLYIRLEYDTDLFQSGVPNIAADVQGKNTVFDPRDSATKFTTNPALCILDYLTSEDGYGAQGDEINEASFITAANLCDEAVDLNADGTLTQARYTLDGSFALDAAPVDILEGMLTCCGGTMTYVLGEHRLHVGAFDSATDTLTVSDMAGAMSLETKPPKSALFNSVKGTFISPADGWQASEFPAWQDAALVTADGGEAWRDADFPFTIDPTRCQRLAKMLLAIARESITIRCQVRYAGLRYQVWQVVNVTLADFGFVAKPFRIVRMSFNPADGLIDITLREESAASYAWLYDDPAAYPAAPDTTLIDPLNIPPPTSVVVTPTTTLQSDGAVTPALLVTWTAAAHAFVRAHEVQWRVTDGPGEWAAAEVPAGTNRFVIAPATVGVTLDVRVRAIAGLVRSPWTSTATGAGAADTTAPGVPTGLSGTGIPRGVSWRWTNPGDTDLALVEVWESANGGAYAKIGESRSNFFVSSGYAPAETRLAIVRAVDRSGNASAFTSTASGTAALSQTADITSGAVSNGAAASWSTGSTSTSYVTLASVTVSDASFAGQVSLLAVLYGIANDTLEGNNNEGFVVISSTFSMRIKQGGNVIWETEQRTSGTMVYADAIAVAAGSHTFTLEGKIGGAGAASLSRAVISATLLKR